MARWLRPSNGRRIVRSVGITPAVLSIRTEEHAQSDIDLLVVGDVGLADLAPTLRKVEARLGREVNVTSYAAVEFRRKAAANDHFLSEVLRGPTQFVKGDQRDVDDLVGKPRRATASDVETRAR